MDPLYYELSGRAGGRVVSKNPERFLRPEDFAAGNNPAEAAGVTQALGFREIPPAPLEFLRQRFLVGDIYARAGETCQYSVVKDGCADAAYPPHSAFRVYDP